MDKLYKSRLRKFRKQLIMRSTQLEFSEDIDVTPEYYSTVETGNNTPSMSLNIDICTKLNKPSDCFFKEKRHDITLTTEQFDYLNSLDTSKLKPYLAFYKRFMKKINSNYCQNT